MDCSNGEGASIYLVIEWKIRIEEIRQLETADKSRLGIGSLFNNLITDFINYTTDTKMFRLSKIMIMTLWWLYVEFLVFGWIPISEILCQVIFCSQFKRLFFRPSKSKLAFVLFYVRVIGIGGVAGAKLRRARSVLKQRPEALWDFIRSFRWKSPLDREI